ncbi:MAG: hypothetical protein E7421_04365 [Ruminococcaceae bacterium]|nr:hypothetical protein [Oscillospiraceae bacterium]
MVSYYTFLCNRKRILDEWDVERNLPLTPGDVAHTSDIPVWWRCKKGHSWCTQVRSHSRSSTGCPVCRGKTGRETATEA